MTKQVLKTNLPYFKRKLTLYFFLRLLVIISGILQLLHGNFWNTFLCGYTLLLFMIPSFIDKKLNIELPNLLESIILLFIFAAEILRRGKKFLWNISLLGYNATYHKWFFMCRNRFFIN